MDVSGVTSQIMELKTSTPYVTRNEEIEVLPAILPNVYKVVLE